MVKIQQLGNLLHISPWLPALAYETTCRKRERKLNKYFQVKYVTEELPLYHVSPDGTHGFALAGFLKRVKAYMEQHRIEYEYEDTREPLDDRDLDIPGISYRHGQREILQSLIRKHNGLVRCPPAFGKSFIIEILCKIYPDKRILVTTARSDVLKDLVPRIKKRCPESPVYLCNATKTYRQDAKVIVCSSKSLHKIDADWPEIIVYDEVHGAAAWQTAVALTAFSTPRIYGFSATPTNRSDGGERIIEGIFGDIIADISHEEAVESGNIVPMEVRLVDAVGKEREFKSEMAMMRHGFWRNGERNARIAYAARRIEQEFDKVLIMVATAEHAYYLRMFLPDYTVVHATMDASRQEELRVAGILGMDENPNKDPVLVKEQFKDGTLRKVIATMKWKEGVDFPDLGVIIRADGQPGYISSIQIGGRTSRIFTDKTKGIVVDFTDRYGPEMQGRAERRIANYRRQGWTVSNWL
jgi:superfamily II DNA or RNA helicase